MSLVFYKLRKALGVMIFPAICLLAIGCGSDDNVTGPDTDPDPEPEVVIKTPKSLTITYISARAFSHKKANGDTWDWNPVSILDEFPDVYATIAEAGKDAAYRSETVEDQQSTDRPDLSTADASSPNKLPYTLSCTKTYTFALYDDDVLNADDLMAQMNVFPLNFYLNDNASSFSRTLEGINGVKLEIKGRWEY